MSLTACDQQGQVEPSASPSASTPATSTPPTETTGGEGDVGDVIEYAPTTDVTVAADEIEALVAEIEGRTETSLYSQVVEVGSSDDPPSLLLTVGGGAGVADLLVGSIREEFLAADALLIVVTLAPAQSVEGDS